MVKINIEFSKQALKFLNKQDNITKKRILVAIYNLPSGDVKKLVGINSYRLRVGDFRIIFDKKGNVIFIEKINNRGDVYK